MAWVKLDDAFFRHDKARSAGKDGRALFVASLCYSADRRSDGFIADTHLGVLAAEAEVRTAVAKVLIEVGLWERVEGGYHVHDYLDYQPSADEVEQRRLKRAEAGSKGGTRAAQTRAKRQASATASATAKSQQPPKQPASKPATPLPLTDCSTSNLTPAEASPSAEVARSVVTAFWESSDPRPAVKFIALVKIAEVFIEAGWTEPQLLAGLRKTRAFTKDSIEFTLRAGVETVTDSKRQRSMANIQAFGREA